MGRRRIGLALALAAVTTLSTEHTEAQLPPIRPLEVTLPVRFRVAQIDGRLARTKAWLDHQVEWANRVFAPAGIRFSTVGMLPLPETHAELESRQDRHELGRHLERGVINVFVVGSMRDVDDPQQWRRGVHWRMTGRSGRHFVVLTAIGPPTTLAHELGHFFGNHDHRWVPGNIMSYEHGPAPRFDDDQLRRVLRAARTFLTQQQLLTFDRWIDLARQGVLPALHNPRASEAAGGLALQRGERARPRRRRTPIAGSRARD